jgi:hypothetical protein
MTTKPPAAQVGSYRVGDLDLSRNEIRAASGRSSTYGGNRRGS